MSEKYEILEEFDKFPKGKKTGYARIKYKKCGHEREVRMSTFEQSPRCGCETNDRYASRTEQEFICEINRNARFGEYSLLSPYTNTKTKVRIRHSCGFVWEARSNALLKSKSAFCPRYGQIESHGEFLVARVLEKRHSISKGGSRRRYQMPFRFLFLPSRQKLCH